MEQYLGKTSTMQCAISICIVDIAFCIMNLFFYEVSGYATCTSWFATFVFKLAFEHSITHYVIPIFLWIGRAPVILESVLFDIAREIA